MSQAPADAPLRRTPLYNLHVELGAKMVPFAGYEMPVQYPLGVLKEHLHTRLKAGLFDVAHMGLCVLAGPDHATTAKAIETLIPADIVNLKSGQQRYSQLLADDGGILDDLMVTRPADRGADGTLLLVVNAACKGADYAHISSRLPAGVKLEITDDLALIALQGPTAAQALSRFVAGADQMPFMSGRVGSFDGHQVQLTRSGYTGEDGYEIAVSAAHVCDVWQALSQNPDVQPIGLGARDSLRLEAGLCLYGHDIDTTTTPVDAALTWSIQKRRREEGGFPGAARIQRQLRDGPQQLRVGIKPDGRAPAREGAEILDAAGNSIGTVTSGGFGPTVNGPIAMGYVAAGHARIGNAVQLVVRGKLLPARVAQMPFTPHRYFRKPLLT